MHPPMLGAIQSLLRTFQMKILSTKELIFDCEDIIKPMVAAILDNPLPTKTIIKPNNLHYYGTKEFEEYDSSDFRIVGVNGKIENIDLSNKNTLYLFLYENEDDCEDVCKYYHKYLFDNTLPNACMPNVCFTYLIGYLRSERGKNKGIMFYCLSTEKWTDKILAFLVMICLIFGIHKLCNYLVNRVSSFDPVFSDFNILSSDLIKFKNLLTQDNPHCTICFEDFEGDEDVRILECQHYFHPKCIDRWLIGHSKKCPCCRSYIEINEKV